MDNEFVERVRDVVLRGYVSELMKAVPKTSHSRVLAVMRDVMAATEPNRLLFVQYLYEALEMSVTQSQKGE